MRKQIAIILLMLLSLSNLFIVTGETSQNETNIKKYEEILTEKSTDIIKGIAQYPSVETLTYEKSVIPMTFLDISIIDAEKTLNIKESSIRIVYETGAYRNPWGLVDIKLGKLTKLYLVPSEDYIDCYYVLGSELLEKPTEVTEELLILSAPFSKKIYEEQGLNFKWEAQDYLDVYSYVNYYVIPSSCPTYLESQDWFNAIKNAFTTWDNEGYSNLDFDYAGNRTYLKVENGFNEVSWLNYESETISVCIPRPIAGHEKTEFDITLNTRLTTWCVGSQSGKYDVQNCVTHEVGHALILDDLYDGSNNAQTMYWVIFDEETKKQTLATGDKNGAQFMSPRWNKPTVTMVDPDDYEVFYTTNVNIKASVSSVYTISSVQYKVTDRYDFLYDSGWQTMSKVGSYYQATWTGTDGDFYVTVRAKNSKGIYGYNYSRITVELD